MATCIYCLDRKPASAFTKAEHVMPESFGRFRDNLTLHGIVCDECNHFFGNELELHLARDTPDGLNRFLVGGKDQSTFKTLGKRSTLAHKADSGPLRGAAVIQHVTGGRLGVRPIPQVGFGQADDGPFEWFPVDSLPTRDELKRLVEGGYQHIYLCEIHDPEPVLAVLRARGLAVSDVIETRPAGWQSVERIETRGLLGMTFGRAITKIALNYVAHEYGAGTALMAQFNTARHFVRYGGKPDERRIWEVVEAPPRQPSAAAHRIDVEWEDASSSVEARISFHGTTGYRIALGSGFLVAAVDHRSHVFDLSTKSVRRVR